MQLRMQVLLEVLGKIGLIPNCYGTILPSVEYPNCLHTTCASKDPQKSSQTLLHAPLKQTSTRPSFSLLPLAIRTLPSLVQGTAGADMVDKHYKPVIHC